MSILDDANKSVNDARITMCVTDAVLVLRKHFNLNTQDTEEMIRTIFDKLIEIGKRKVM